jgi:hypothetical protein
VIINNFVGSYNFVLQEVDSVQANETETEQLKFIKKGQVFPALKTSPSSSRGYEEFDPTCKYAK